jgi:hypothetical protein
MRAIRGTRRCRSFFVVGAVAGLAVVGLAGSASAQSSTVGNEDQVVFSGSLVVPSGETAHTAVIFDGPATIAGTVEQTLVVFHGDVEITGTIGKDVVVFDGDVTVRSGAEVGGDIVSRATPTVEPGATVRGSTQRLVGRFDFGKIGFASRIAWWIGYSASALILGMILLLMAPGLDGALARAARERIGAVIGIGVGWFFLLPVAAVLLLATVVGIPLGLFVLLALAFLYTVAYVAGALAIGRLLVKAPASRFLAFLAGWGILRVLALVPVLAGFAFTITAIVGFGVLVAAARRTPVDTSLPPAPPMPTSPPPGV